MNPMQTLTQRLANPTRWLRELRDRFTTDEERHGGRRSAQQHNDVTFF